MKPTHMKRDLWKRRMHMKRALYNTSHCQVLHLEKGDANEMLLLGLTFREAGSYFADFTSKGLPNLEVWFEVNVYMYKCIYVYIHIYICLYLHMYIYKYIYIYVYVYIYLCIYICIYIFTCIYLSMCIFVYTFIYSYMYWILFRELHLRGEYVCMYIYVCIYI